MEVQRTAKEEEYMVHKFESELQEHPFDYAPEPQRMARCRAAAPTSVSTPSFEFLLSLLISARNGWIRAGSPLKCMEGPGDCNERLSTYNIGTGIRTAAKCTQELDLI